MTRRIPPDSLPSNWDKQYVTQCEGLNDKNRVVFDYRVSKGLGAAGYNQNVATFGFIGFMLPATFLKLASQLVNPDDRSISGLPKLAETYAWGPPTLYVSMDRLWVQGHEGRHRCTLLNRTCPDTLIPVHFFPRSKYTEYRSYKGNITRDVADRIRSGLFDEGNRVVPGDDTTYYRFIPGPLFDVAFVAGKYEEWGDGYRTDLRPDVEVDEDDYPESIDTPNIGPLLEH